MKSKEELVDELRRVASDLVDLYDDDFINSIHLTPDGLVVLEGDGSTYEFKPKDIVG